MHRRLMSVALALVFALSVGAVTTWHAPSAHAAPSCYSTYQETKADSGWRYDYTPYGDIKDRAQIVAVFDTQTGSLCRAYSVFMVNIEQYLNQCSYNVTYDFHIGSSYTGGSARTSSCWHTYTYYSASLNPISGQTYWNEVFTNEGYDHGAGVSWRP